MAKATISTPKQARIDARQRYEPKSKTRSGISVFARTVQGTPTRSMANPQTTKAAAVRARILKPADSGLAGRAGGKPAFADRAGLASGTGMGTTYRGVSSLWKSGLDFEGMRPYPGSPLVENVDVEDEGEGYDEDSHLDDVFREDSDVEWGDERTLIDGLMGFDDESIQNKAKRQEVLTESLREHFSSLSVSIKQDLLDAVVPVIDNLATTTTVLRKGPDSDYKDAFVAFNNVADANLSTFRTINDDFGELKDQSLLRLKHIVGRIETERTKRTELCDSFKARYTEICSRAKDRLARLIAEDLEHASVALQNRANVIVSGKDKEKEKMRQKILEAFA
ncbi:hypothetical protein BDV93DRAFT_2124 [Ceratobasidium sp. AG-I]|nr:hypothetical protein BDV93DRAFT_2124 [Ceratobasidium sp. AG-I]